MQDIMVRTNTERDSDRVGQRERETGCIAKVFGKGLRDRLAIV